MKLSGKTALVTGGNSGIGRAIAELFTEQGARVAITGRDAERLEDTLLDLGPDALAFQSDAGNLAEIDQLMTSVKDEMGGLDVLVLNAASTFGAITMMDGVSEQEFDHFANISFKGVFFAIQKAIPLMRPGSSIIVITSITNQGGVPGFSVYAACKAAARSLVQTAALELIGRGIRVNAISPGPINTYGFERFTGDAVDAAREQLTNKSPMQRFGAPQEVADAALFLASDDSTYIVGTELVVDGGISLLV